MKEQTMIPAQTICLHYNVEVSFVDTLNTMGLIKLEVIEETQFIHRDQISELEKIMRLHNELQVNLEGIDVVLNLLEKERELRRELHAVKNRLRLYEKE